MCVCVFSTCVFSVPTRGGNRCTDERRSRSEPPATSKTMYTVEEVCYKFVCQKKQEQKNKPGFGAGTGRFREVPRPRRGLFSISRSLECRYVPSIFFFSVTSIGFRLDSTRPSDRVDAEIQDRNARMLCARRPHFTVALLHDYESAEKGSQVYAGTLIACVTHILNRWPTFFFSLTYKQQRARAARPSIL